MIGLMEDRGRRKKEVGYLMRRSSIYCVRLRRQSVYVLDAYSNVLQIAVAAVSYCPGASHCPDISPTLLAAHKIHIYGLILFSVIAMATYYGNPPLLVAVRLASDRLFARLCIA